MKAIILCAGLGSRLNSKKPKGFIVINNKTLLERCVKNLISVGFKGFSADSLRFGVSCKFTCASKPLLLMRGINHNHTKLSIYLKFIVGHN